MQLATPSLRQRHRWFEDAIAILTAALLISLSTLLVRTAGLSTGGVVGIAFLLHYAMDWRFGAVFFLVNVPFYWLGYRARGGAFIFKTMASVALTAALAELIPAWITVNTGGPGYAAVLSGVLAGVGMLVLFRHNASFGGFGVLALQLQQRRGWRAGHVMLAVDVTVLAASLLVMPLDRTLWSIVGAVAMNITVALNHRSDRYLGY